MNINVIIIQESRILKFWFSPETEYFDRVTCAYEFFKELVRPENFPRGNYPMSCYLCIQPLVLFVNPLDVDSLVM